MIPVQYVVSEHSLDRLTTDISRYASTRKVLVLQGTRTGTYRYCTCTVRLYSTRYQGTVGWSLRLFAFLLLQILYVVGLFEQATSAVVRRVHAFMMYLQNSNRRGDAIHFCVAYSGLLHTGRPQYSDTVQVIQVRRGMSGEMYRKNMLDLTNSRFNGKKIVPGPHTFSYHSRFNEMSSRE